MREHGSCIEHAEPERTAELVSDVDETRGGADTMRGDRVNLAAISTSREQRRSSRQLAARRFKRLR
jgi:hypothetical protein